MVLNTGIETICVPPQDQMNNNLTNLYRWSDVDERTLLRYQSVTDYLLSKIVIPVDTLTCVNSNCECESHKSELTKFYNNIIQSLLLSCERCIPKPKNKCDFVIPGWNTYVKSFHSHARSCYLLWRNCGKLRQGDIYVNMVTSRMSFKNALKQCKTNEQQIKAELLAESLYNKDDKKFWKCVKRYSTCRVSKINTVDGCHGDTEIASMWQKHFNSILNCVNNVQSKESVVSQLSGVEFDQLMVTPVSEIKDTISKLECGKSAGPDGLSAEAFKFASNRLHAMLSCCFSSFFVHGYLPDQCIDTVIIPLVKNKCGDLTDKGNYRPIAIASVASKLIEHLVLQRVEQFLYTSSSQFGFKSKHSTDMCVYLLNEVIDFHKRHNTTVFVTFVDASKAFDRVNHYTLFSKLLARKVPIFIVKLLMYWYTKQSMMIRWGNTLSDRFTVSNGVKQGGILSPALFNVYMDDLSSHLISSNVGCRLSGYLVNHISYADDMCLMSPTPSGMQKLLNICGQYAVTHDLKYNAEKSVCMVFSPRRFRHKIPPKLHLNDLSLHYVTSQKYLGVIVQDSCCKLDITRQMRKLYGNANLLTRSFGTCSVETKLKLFKTYCLKFYCDIMWYNVKQSDLNALKVAYINSFRRLMKLSYRCSASEMFVNHNVSSFKEVLRKSTHNFISRLKNSNNSLIKTVLHSSIPLSSSIWSHWHDMIYVHRVNQ